jgi:DNA-binding response OmpR family regulator
MEGKHSHHQSDATRRTRLLLADHDENLAAGLVSMLHSAGFEVFHALDGKAALSIQARTPAELVIAEMLLPELDGFEMMVQLSRQVARPKFVAMTSGGKLGPDFYLRTARQLGAHGVIAKPFDQKRLLGIIQAVLRGEEPDASGPSPSPGTPKN